MRPVLVALAVLAVVEAAGVTALVLDWAAPGCRPARVFAVTALVVGPAQQAAVTVLPGLHGLVEMGLAALAVTMAGWGLGVTWDHECMGRGVLWAACLVLVAHSACIGGVLAMRSCPKTETHQHLLQT